MIAILKNWFPRTIFAFPPVIGFGATLYSSLTHSHAQGVMGIWPPLGNLEVFASFIASCFIGACCAYASRIKSKMLLLPLIVAGIFLLGYAALVLEFVKSVDSKQYGTLYRSVGYKKIDAAVKANPDLNDGELLEAGNLSDTDIEKVWTPFSVWVVRLSLFTVYVVGLSALNIFWGMYENSTEAAAT